MDSECESIEKEEGDDVQFICHVTPEDAVVQWYVRGTLVDFTVPESRFHLETILGTRVLKIKKCFAHDSGDVCAIAGSKICKGVLNVIGIDVHIKAIFLLFYATQK